MSHKKGWKDPDEWPTTNLFFTPDSTDSTDFSPVGPAPAAPPSPSPPPQARPQPLPYSAGALARLRGLVDWKALLAQVDFSSPYAEQHAVHLLCSQPLGGAACMAGPHAPGIDGGSRLPADHALGSASLDNDVCCGRHVLGEGCIYASPFTEELARAVLNLQPRPGPPVQGMYPTVYTNEWDAWLDGVHVIPDVPTRGQAAAGPSAFVAAPTAGAGAAPYATAPHAALDDSYFAPLRRSYFATPAMAPVPATSGMPAATGATIPAAINPVPAMIGATVHGATIAATRAAINAPATATMSAPGPATTPHQATQALVPQASGSGPARPAPIPSTRPRRTPPSNDKGKTKAQPKAKAQPKPKPKVTGKRKRASSPPSSSPKASASSDERARPTSPPKAPSSPRKAPFKPSFDIRGVVAALAALPSGQTAAALTAPNARLLAHFMPVLDVGAALPRLFMNELNTQLGEAQVLRHGARMLAGLYGIFRDKVIVAYRTAVGTEVSAALCPPALGAVATWPAMAAAGPSGTQNQN